MRKRVLFIAEAYYVSWYLSRSLRQLGWKADVLSMHPQWDSYSHGADYRIPQTSPLRLGWFLLKALFRYDLYVFSGFLFPYMELFRWVTRLLGKKIVYVSSGCNDGHLQSSVERQIGLCEHCGWPPGSCTDIITRKRGEKRNKVADLVYAPDLLLADYNAAPFVDYPFYFCLSTDFWQPGLLIPANHKLCSPGQTIRIFHGMANIENRSHLNKNAKGTPAILDAVDRLKAEGMPVELIYVTGLPGRDVRFYMDQCDIVIEQLYYGWVGMTAREGLAMGKPVIANINQAWLRNISSVLPGYDFPVIHANVDTIYAVLKDLILNPAQRIDIGQKGRAFAQKWLDSSRVARILDVQWQALLNGQVSTLRSGSFPQGKLKQILE